MPRSALRARGGRQRPSDHRRPVELPLYANQYTKPFNEISGVVTELQNALACAGRVFELIDEPAQTPDPADAEKIVHPTAKSPSTMCISPIPRIAS